MAASADDFLLAHEERPEKEPADFEFTSSDLIDGRLSVPDVLPGGITVVDGDGYMVIPDQSEIRDEFGKCTGVSVDLRPFSVSGTWRIRYGRGKRGMKGDRGEGGIMSYDEMMMHVILFT